MQRRHPSGHGRPLRSPSGGWPGSVVGCARVRRWADRSARQVRRTWRRPESFRVEVLPLATGPDASLLSSHRTDASGNITVTLYAWPLLTAAPADAEPTDQLVHRHLVEQLADALGVHPDDL